MRRFSFLPVFSGAVATGSGGKGSSFIVANREGNLIDLIDLEDFRDGEGVGIGGRALRSFSSKAFVDRILDARELRPVVYLPISMSS